jgi:hypothetical protein
MPVPPIYIRILQSGDHTRVVREIVDGQQRVSAVLDFVDGKFRLSRTLDVEWAGKTFAELAPRERRRITSFSFPAEVFQGISDLEVLEIFARLNTYSVPLNAQELRNGKYFGLFKSSAYGLALEHLQFWRENRVFSERSIARMLEVEFTSEVMIAQIAGMQDKKKSIEDFYAKFDEEYPARAQVERRFRATVDEINECLQGELTVTEFRRAPLLYTLFCAIYHRVYRLPRVTLSTPTKPLSREERLAVRDVVGTLSDRVSSARIGRNIPRPYQKFVAACLRQTDNIGPRQERLQFVYNRCFA